jgi:hypothetical protein
MAKQTINIGASPNDGTGTPLRTAFDYTNQNFTELYTATGPSGNNIVVPGNATITGDLTVDTNTFVVVASTDSVGVGFIPSAWGGGRKAIQIGSPAQVVSSDLTLEIGSNWWHDGTNYRYTSTNSAALYSPSNGSHTWFTAPSGTAGNTVGWSTAMTLNATGLGVGRSPSYKLDIAGVGNFDQLRIAAGSATKIDLVNGTTAVTYSLFNANSASNGFDGFGIFNGTSYDLRIVNGNVGIGVTPSAWNSSYRALQIGATGALWQSASGFTFLSDNAFVNSGASNTYITTAAASFYRQNAGVHTWWNAPSGTAGNAITFTQAMTLDASGNLLIGTTTNTDAYRTNIQFSGASVNGLIVKNLASTGGPVLLYLHDSAQTVNTTAVSAEYVDSTTQRWRLYKNGGLANYQANNVNLSDVRTKTDIKPLGSYWNKIKSLEVVTFKYNDQTHSDDNIGLIAQQVESVAPELVDVDGFGETPVDGVPLKTIYTTDLYHASIKALQEAMSRIEALEAKLA